MIVLGADMHKRSHTVAAVSAATGEARGEKTGQVGAKRFAALLTWARGLGEERVSALEDCRHVSGAFERFLIARGERVLRVPTRLGPRGRRSRERPPDGVFTRKQVGTTTSAPIVERYGRDLTTHVCQFAVRTIPAWRRPASRAFGSPGQASAATASGVGRRLASRVLAGSTVQTWKADPSRQRSSSP
jgi:hypothetical protein